MSDVRIIKVVRPNGEVVESKLRRRNPKAPRPPKPEVTPEPKPEFDS